MKILGDTSNSTVSSPDLFVRSCNVKKSNNKPQVLLKENYLSEYKTKSEKDKVKENLGLLDDLVEWGQIGGYIENQKDLQMVLEKLEKNLVSILTKNSNTLKGLIDKKISKEILDGSSATQQISYTNSEYENIHSLKDALDTILNKELVISLSCTPSVKEQGDTVQSITYTWSFNKKTIETQKFNNQILDNSLRQISIEGPFTTNTTGTLQVDDGFGTYSKSVQLKFYPGIYYGILSTDNIDTNSFLSLSSILQDSRKYTITVDASQINDYIYICIPYTYGTPEFSVNGFSGGFTLLNDNYLVDKYNTGSSIRYMVYRSDNKNLGKTTVIIS